MKLKTIINSGDECRQLTALIAILFVIAALLVSCSGFTIKEEQRLPLIEDQTRSGVYKTIDLELDYRYTYRPGAPGEGGTIDLRGRVARKRRLNSLGINLNCLDTDGKIISSERVYYYVYSKGGGSSFEGNFEIPPGTVSIAFTSNARTRESHG